MLETFVLIVLSHIENAATCSRQAQNSWWAHMYTGRTLVQFTSRSLNSVSVSSFPCQSNDTVRQVDLPGAVAQQTKTCVGSTPCAGTWGRRRPLPGGASGPTAAESKARAYLAGRHHACYVHDRDQAQHASKQSRPMHTNGTRMRPPSSTRPRKSRRCIAPGPAARPGWARPLLPPGHSCRTQLRSRQC